MDTTTQIDHTPLVSILMLTYNRADFIRIAIDSVLAQTYKNFELIIIDDGSTDDTDKVVAQYQDPRIRYINHEENAGLHPRRRESLTYVTGAYVAVLDSDDYWPRVDKLEHQVAAMEDDRMLAVVGTHVALIRRDGAYLRDYRYEESDAAIRNHILLRNQFTHSAVLMRTAFIKQTKGYQPLLAEDLELFLQLGQLGSFLNLDMVGTAHRVHNASMNDHGPKMAGAVCAIVRKHRREYPHGLLATIVSHLRLLKVTVL